MGRKVEEKLDDLNKKTESLDTLVNKEIDKVLILDSIIIRESEKVKKLDSLIEKSASRLDSIVNEKVNQLKK
jgi:copper homeostasis protein CutC